MRNVGLLRSLLTLQMLTSLSICWSMVTFSSANAMGKFPWDAWEREGPVVLHCPPMKSYSKEATARLAKELRELRAKNDKAVTPSVVRDYSTLREQCRVIQSPTGAR